jgi:hypothetical protein
MENETVDLRSKMDCRSYQVCEDFQSIAAMYMGQNLIMFPNLYTRVTSRTAVAANPESEQVSEI